MRYGKWRRILSCTWCGHRLTDLEYAYSSGVCPYCGAIERSTFLNAEHGSARNVYPAWYPLSVLWGAKVTEEVRYE